MAPRLLLLVVCAWSAHEALKSTSDDAASFSITPNPFGDAVLLAGEGRSVNHHLALRLLKVLWTTSLPRVRIHYRESLLCKIRLLNLMEIYDKSCNVSQSGEITVEVDSICVNVSQFRSNIRIYIAPLWRLNKTILVLAYRTQLMCIKFWHDRKIQLYILIYHTLFSNGHMKYSIPRSRQQDFLLSSVIQ